MDVNPLKPVSDTLARLAVYIQPGASKTELAGLHDGLIKIRIAAPPVENAANRVLIEFIAERVGVPKRCIRIVSGSTSRRKVLEVQGISAESLTQTLSAK